MLPCVLRHVLPQNLCSFNWVWVFQRLKGTTMKSLPCQPVGRGNRIPRWLGCLWLAGRILWARPSCRPRETETGASWPCRWEGCRIPWERRLFWDDVSHFYHEVQCYNNKINALFKQARDCKKCLRVQASLYGASLVSLCNVQNDTDPALLPLLH